jgi:hypothetical protein
MTKVINNQSTERSRAHARVVCVGNEPIGHTHTGIINNTCFSDHAHARTRGASFTMPWSPHGASGYSRTESKTR